jgi:hypothetical protein
MSTTPHFDKDALRNQYPSRAPFLRSILEGATTSTLQLPTLMRVAFEVAAFEHHFGAPARTAEAIRLGDEAGLAIFACAQAPLQPVTFTLAGKAVTLESRLGLDAAHGGRWERIFYGATIVDDGAALAALLAIPLSAPLGSSTTGERYQDLWLTILHTLGTTGEIREEQLVEHLDRTDPAALPPDLIDRALYIDVPANELLYHLRRDDEASFVGACAQALDKHLRFWALPENKYDPEGFVSWPLSAIVALAESRGMRVPVDSPYLVRLRPPPA